MKTKFGFWNLAVKTFAVLTTSLGGLINNQAKAIPPTPKDDDTDKDLNYDYFQKKILRSKLVLKLNIYNPDNSYLLMHASHSSHSSHASSSPSSGHSSHSSHMSSSPSYYPSTTKPVPETKVPVYVPPAKNIPSRIIPLKKDPTTLIQYTLGSRTLYRGCSGTDVQELQIILINLGFEVLASGYFDIATETAVKKFQAKNELTVNGRVGKSTLIILQRK